MLQRRKQVEYYSVYEAGFSGYWAHEELERLGIKSIIVHPADIPTNDKQRRVKNDRVDSDKMARSLRSGDLRGIYVPSKEIQEARTLLRLHIQITKETTRIKNQIKSILNFYGKRIPEAFERSHWSKRFIDMLSKIEFETQWAKDALQIQIDRLLFLRGQLTKLIKKLRLLSSAVSNKLSFVFYFYDFYKL